MKNPTLPKNLQDAYELGWSSRRAGMEHAGANPDAQGTAAWDAWEIGWNGARCAGRVCGGEAGKAYDPLWPVDVWLHTGQVSDAHDARVPRYWQVLPETSGARLVWVRVGAGGDAEVVA